MMGAFLFFFVLPWALVSAAEPSPSPTPPTLLDPQRPYLEKLRRFDEVKDADYDSPFLISSTANSVSISLAELEKKSADYLKSGALGYKGHFSRVGLPIDKLTKEGLDLPATSVSGRNLEEIQACSAKKCQVKLTKKEAAAIESAAPAQKLSVFEGALVARLKAFIERDDLIGYDDRESNRGMLAQMLAAIPFMKNRYPQVTQFLAGAVFRKAPPTVVDSFLRKNLVVLDSNLMQPVLRISEVIEFREHGATLFVEIPIYTDHYFDSSLRVYELFPFGEKSAIVVTDVMEIDELKKSAFIRALYRGKMEDAVGEGESVELQHLKDFR